MLVLMPVRVLLVDANRDSETEQVLKSAGHLVTRAFGFEEAKRQLQFAPPDLLMTDVRLGAYNGVHLVLRAHAEHPEMPAIVVDADHDPVLEREANGAGATYVAKPFEAGSLVPLAFVNAERPPWNT
jgi:DNA-binding NtrC family response regulator